MEKFLTFFSEVKGPFWNLRAAPMLSKRKRLKKGDFQVKRAQYDDVAPVLLNVRIGGFHTQ